MADITEERLGEIASSDPLTLAICATLGEPSWADVRAIAAELLAARADLREALRLLGQVNEDDMPKDLDSAFRWLDARDALLAKHKETP